MFELTAPPVLPFDVIGHIIDILFNDGTEGLQYVKDFSLVCHSFLPLCRKHIFSCISINMGFPRNYDKGEAFGRLLLESPDIAIYVRKLKIYIKSSNSHFLVSFPVLPLTMLQSLTISYCGYPYLVADWAKLPSSTQRSFVNLMHLPTLTHLDLKRISGFPISNICTNIKHLFLRELDIIDDEATSLPLWRKSMKLQTLHISYSNFDLEWGGLSSPTQRSLVNLMHLPTLTHLYLKGISGFPISNFNVCTNIKHLFLREFDIIDDETTSLPLCCKSMKLQTLHISISLETRRSIIQDILRKIQQLEDLSLQIDGM